MNKLLVYTNIPMWFLLSKMYDIAREWYGALVNMYMAQLALQYNDTTEDDNNVCDKYVARKLFRRLTNASTLFPGQGSSGGDYTLFSQDLRPANVLLDKGLCVVSMIDWEFAYAAPTEFSLDPPWWLLLLEPECWPGGYKEWMNAYDPRLHTFLRVLEAKETMADKDTPSLSQAMRRSWERGTRWLIMRPGIVGRLTLSVGSFWISDTLGGTMSRTTVLGYICFRKGRKRRWRHWSQVTRRTVQIGGYSNGMRSWRLPVLMGCWGLHLERTRAKAAVEARG